ncbi:WD40 repeat-like protein [Schizophyllum commune Tattone D]|nr:WD40 repeat-like protein [Schizophyllum commune Tattone D]
MSSSCQGLIAALKDCLMHSDCVIKDGRMPSDCLHNHADELPLECQTLRRATFECKRGMLDMRKRFRGNIVGSQYTYQADPEEKEREAKLLAEAMAKHSKPSDATEDTLVDSLVTIVASSNSGPENTNVVVHMTHLWHQTLELFALAYLPRIGDNNHQRILLPMEASSVYIAASTNRHSHAADVSSEDLVAFGTRTMIALWPAEGAGDAGVQETLASDHARVTCVRFITADRLASADEHGLLRLWREKEGKWVSTASVKAHAQGISSLCVRGTLLVSGSSDATVRLWDLQEDEDKIAEVQTISLNGRYPLSLALAILPETSTLILAIGDTSRNVQLWTRSEDKFIKAANLSGHEDWVRALAFREPTSADEGSSSAKQEPSVLVLASGAQDASIRLWNIEPVRRGSADGTDDLLDAFEASLGETTDGEEGGRQITMKRHLITVKAGESTQQYSVIFDALLVGHEAGVTSLSWRPAGDHPDPAPTLLSTSTDSSLILWSPAPTGTLWVTRQRFGDVGGQRLGGFVGGLWVARGGSALAWGWAGGWRRWGCAAVEGGKGENWEEKGAITGHSGPVRGLAWAPGGEYLLSTGLDQTARIHAPVATAGGAWHEIARPQVHGYDLLRGIFLDRLRYASIADEKVTRVFDAPRSFVESAERLGVATFDAAEVDPSAMSATGDITDHRPFEGELAAITLWPEAEKVFGHGYELIALAASNSKKIIATACKATTPEHAVVRLHDTERWQPVGQPLPGHSLTVTRIAFSPDDSLILSVSRDRTWRLFARQEDGGYTPIAADKSHGRIIWDCAWAHEGDVFATASRDKTVKFWQNDGSKWTAIASIKAKEAATAVDFAPKDENGRRLLAVGLENGDILIYASSTTDTSKWELVTSKTQWHVGQLQQLSWRPSPRAAAGQQLASCSEDDKVWHPNGYVNEVRIWIQYTVNASE